MKHWKIKLRPLTPWTSETLLKIWQQPLNKMETLGGGEFCEEDPYIKGLIPVLKSLSCERILGSIKATRHLRLFLQLWANRGSEFQSFPDSIEEFQILQNLPFEPTRSCYIATIYLWLDSYHRPVEFRKNLVAYIKFLSLKIRPPKNIDSQVGRLLQYQDDILAENGPLRVVIFAAKRNLTLENALKQMGLELRNKCSFIVACYSLHYLNKLEQCLLGEAIPELAELVQPGIYNMRFAKELTVGQEAIRIMIDRALEKHSSPGETWLEFILKLTGDPRPAVEGTTNHRKWWSTLKEHRRQALIRWLAIDDIKLFLEILRDHADHASAEILRMFVPRKNFLEKLIETKLIQSARLFLSKEAHAYVRRKFTDRVLKYARIKSGEQSFIYLDLGKVHMVEGTHNASVRLYSKLPPKSRLADYRSEVFGANEIRPNSEDTIVHSGSWQIKLVFHLLQYGLDVSFEDLLVEDDWWEYRRKYGVGEFDSEVREENYWDYFDD